jgi:alpha-tubulin suppressor-like RCC1 family protein
MRLAYKQIGSEQPTKHQHNVINRTGKDHMKTLNHLGIATRGLIAAVTRLNALYSIAIAGSALMLASCGGGSTPTAVTARTVNPLTHQLAPGKKDHTCALKPGGTVACWGYGGALGNGSSGTIDSNIPVAVSNLANVSAVASGGAHSCALDKTNGSVACWGLGGFGQLGDGSFGNLATSNTPVRVSGLVGVTAITSGHFFSCALNANATVSCWGDDSAGQLGNGTGGSIGSIQTTPTLISNLTNVTTITAGEDHACALKTNGTVSCWGRGDRGELGNGQSLTSLTPVDVKDPSSTVAHGVILADVKALYGGFQHTCAVKTTGDVLCWGRNAAGMLGYGVYGTVTNATVPVLATSLAGLSISSIAIGGAHACALKADGTAVCWGLGTDGQLGDGTSGTTVYSTAPVDVAGLTDATEIAAGGTTTCARTSNGNAFCWGGTNLRGELGNSTFSPVAKPSQVTGLAL